jgi:hypothetical protein
MPNMEPLDHYIAHPQPDAVADAHAEVENLARVALAAGDALARTAAQRGARQAKSLAAQATTGMGAAADELAQARTAAENEKDSATALAMAVEDGPGLGQQAAGASAPTIGDMLDASEPPAGPGPTGTGTGATTGTTTPDLGVDPTAEIPITVGDLLDASHPLSLHEELAAAQVSTGTVPTSTTQAVETSLTADVALG